MTFKKIDLIAIALFFISLACLSSQTVEAVAPETLKGSKTQPRAEYVKPGAAIALRHDYDGQTEKGELETFTLTLEHIYTEGYLTARVLDASGLRIHSDMNPQQVKLHTGSTVSFPIQFSAAQSGEYYLGVEVIYETLAGDQSLRVLSVALSVGEQHSYKTKLPNQQKAGIETHTGIIALPAQETIR